MPAFTGDDAKRVRNPIDAFVLAKLRVNGLHPSPEANRCTLVRRLTFDLTGLPPTPEETDAFLKDASADAYERLVDRLLASPRYGERWARHWLDVAHYADSHGQDEDRPRPNAWPYRDWVIESLNADKPYDRFVKEQVAGDVLFPDDPGAIAATGFLAAGPWDESGLMGIREDSLDRLIAHNLDRDDMVCTTLSSFAGLTVGCARCHDHKFDPVSQADYYALQAVFAGVDKADRLYDADPKVARTRREATAQLARLKALAKDDPALLTPERQSEAAKWEAAVRAAQTTWVVANATGWQSKNGATLKPQADGSVLSAGARPEKDTCTGTFAAPVAGATAFRLEVLCDDSLPQRGPGRQDNGNLHLSEVRVWVQPKGKPAERKAVKIKAATADFDQSGWDVARAIDGDPATAWGIFPRVGVPHAAVFEFDAAVAAKEPTEFVVELDQLHGGGHLIGRFRVSFTASANPRDTAKPLPPELRKILDPPAEKRTPTEKAEVARVACAVQLDRQLTALPPQAKVYCGTNKFPADGTFRPAATPRPVFVLQRGDVSKPGKAAEPGAVAAVPGLTGRFKLTDANDEGQRRAALAGWLTDPANPLTWRVMANRVWHYHFGRGIADTPNDFGKMGGPPSHPELLDWLAAEFRDDGQSLKKLHKLIVTSSTYRQQVKHDAAAAAKDADNRLLWRMNRTRLDAEQVRDAVLLASGRLDDAMYGPPVKHFIESKGVHVTPVADYDKYDVDAPDARRRSVYRYVFRTVPDPLLDALDCPDASQSAPARTSSVSAVQALALWNNKFTLRHAEHLAALAEKSSKEVDAQVAFAARRTLNRPPTDAEAKEWTAYARKHGLANLCRVLFNSSEFLFAE